MNGDRHIENWGFLEDKTNGECKIAPVYDCGSALFALYSEEKCLRIINTPREYKNLALNSFSAMKENGSKINYFNFINSLSNSECNKALLEIFPKININIIKNIINATPLLSDIYKKFYTDVIETSYELVLKPAYEKIIL